ncbi:unnamed protein product [Prorocentrum cordatum]|uniref:Uncharacterized protein n=1 Tax=Prorocentrum cordatum TaxID=2364126 RepID=A0ABN9TDR3_9DINO|nr:unnamed protein product [Polarella glacialis]
MEANVISYDAGTSACENGRQRHQAPSLFGEGDAKIEPTSSATPLESESSRVLAAFTTYRSSSGRCALSVARTCEQDWQSKQAMSLSDERWDQSVGSERGIRACSGSGL